MDMCCVFCCCDASADEREPLIIESARQARSPSRAVSQMVGKIVVRHVGVSDLDRRFADIAETFNEQHDRYVFMKNAIGALAYRYRCSPAGSLSECLQKIRHEHETHHIQLQIKGCYFSLAVTPGDDVPDKLRLTQDSVVELFQATVAVDSSSVKLQGMIDSYLEDGERLTARVREAASTYQDRQRLEGNLHANLQEARRAKEASSHYREEARKLQKEAQLVSGMPL